MFQAIKISAPLSPEHFRKSYARSDEPALEPITVKYSVEPNKLELGIPDDSVTKSQCSKRSPSMRNNNKLIEIQGQS